MKGRPPRPSKIQTKLRGDNRRKGDRDLEAPNGKPPCPDHVKSDPIAFDKWNATCDHLDNMGILSECDAVLLETFALTYSKWRRAEERCRTAGDVVLVGPNKVPQVAPWYSAHNTYWEQLRKLMV